MIAFSGVSKQYGRQILFVDASFQLNDGEKVGLVGPNGAGKTTLFRMIVGEEQPDEGQVAVDRGVSIGYFSQDVGDMAGRTPVVEVMEGKGPAAAVMAEMTQLEHAMGDPERMDQLDAIMERYGEVQHQFEKMDGYSLDAQA